MPTGRSDVTNMKQNWVPDADVSECMAVSCGKRFSTLKRKHHCRLCGNVFCHSCSQQKTTRGLGGEIFAKPERACMECYTKVKSAPTADFRTSVSRPGSQSFNVPSPTDGSDSEGSESESESADDDSSLSAGEQLEGYAARYTKAPSGSNTVWPQSAGGTPCSPATHKLMLTGVGAVELPIVPLPAPPPAAATLDGSIEVPSRSGVCPLVLQHCGVRFGATVGKALARQLQASGADTVLGVSTGSGCAVALGAARALGAGEYALAQKAESGLEPHQQQEDMVCASYNDTSSSALVKNKTLQLDKRCSLHGSSVAIVHDSISSGEMVKALLRLARETGATVVAVAVVLETSAGGWRKVLGNDAELVTYLGSVPIYSIGPDGTATAEGVEPEPEPEPEPAPVARTGSAARSV